MKKERMLSSLKMLLLTTICILLASTPALANSQSANVAIIGSPNVVSGGYLPTDSGITGLGITFTNLAPGNVNAANLALYDTVVLNVASSEMGRTTATLTTQAKADLVTFVGNGGKMIIYDSECPSVDYSWLPFPFTTNNPGAQGAHGTLTIVEENTLSSKDPTDPYYIDAAYLGSSTDAVGDMNVMVTLDPYWCIDMSGTNVNQVTGPVHTYAKVGVDEGLYIYNGLDVDMMGSGSNSLREIWIQELKQPFNPSGLPCGVTVVGITLEPATAENEVGEEHTVTATLTDLLGNPITDMTVNFNVVSGPNAGDTGSDTTDTNGEATFNYTGDGGVGTDTIKACFSYSDGTKVCSQPVTKEWIISNTPPVANAGPDQTVEQANLAGTSVTLDGSGSTDDGQIASLTYTWTWSNGGSATGDKPVVTLPLGTTTVTLTVYDGEFSSTDDVVIKVVDTTSPEITCPADVTVEQETADGTEVSLTATATDLCDAAVDITSDAPSIFPLGPTIVTFTATDDSGNSASCTTTVTVVDTTTPTITTSGKQKVLWPANHKYQTVSISDCVASVKDICDAGVGIKSIEITSVSSDEPEEVTGDGDGNTMADIVIKDSQTVDLRAEREGTGNGRVYTINYEVTDISGNTATGFCQVWVPHDQGAGATAIDDGAGAGYTVTP